MRNWNVRSRISTVTSAAAAALLASMVLVSADAAASAAPAEPVASVAYATEATQDLAARSGGGRGAFVSAATVSALLIAAAYRKARSDSYRERNGGRKRR